MFDASGSFHQVVHMACIQIHLPEDLYVRARKLADEREISLAELTRSELGYILRGYSSELK